MRTTAKAFHGIAGLLLTFSIDFIVSPLVVLWKVIEWTATELTYLFPE